MITDPCGNCHGEGRAVTQRKLSVKIPAGVDEGTRIRVAGEGEAGVRGAASGDLYLFVHMKRHPIYAREGTTLDRRMPGQLHDRGARRVDQPARASTAPRSTSRFRAGIQSGEQLRHRGSGMSVLNGRGRGDLVARILVETPTPHAARSRRSCSRNFAGPRRATNARREELLRRSRSAASSSRLISRFFSRSISKPQREQLREQLRRRMNLQAGLARRAVSQRNSPSTPSALNGTRSVERIRLPRARASASLSGEQSRAALDAVSSSARGKIATASAWCRQSSPASRRSNLPAR